MIPDFYNIAIGQYKLLLEKLKSYQTQLYKDNTFAKYIESEGKQKQNHCYLHTFPELE